MMRRGCLRLEHLPADVHGLEPLERAALAGSMGRAAVARKLEELTPPSDPYLPAEREELAQRLEARATSFSTHVAALDSLRALAQPKASCVMFRAEPRFLTGPFSTLLMGAQVVKLAKDLERAWGTAVVPVLWNEDEATNSEPYENALLLNRNFERQRVRLEAVTRGPQTVSEVKLASAVHGLGAARALLAQLFGDFEFIEEALEIFMPREGESLARAFTRNMSELLGPHGLVVIEASQMRAECSGALAKLLSGRFLEELQAGCERIASWEELDLCSQSLALHRVDTGWRSMGLGGDGFRYDDEAGSRTAAELAAQIVQEPQEWRAGAHLGPLVRGAVLPVAVQVGSQEDLRAHLLTEGLHEAADRPRPNFVRGLTATLVEEDAGVSLDRLGTTLVQALRHGVRAPETSESKALVRELDQLATRTTGDLKALRRRMDEIAETLRTPLRRSSRAIDAEIRKLIDTVRRVHAYHGGREARHLRHVNEGLRPDGGPQDRVFGPFAQVARYGRGWLDELVDELDPMGSEHLGIHLGPI